MRKLFKSLKDCRPDRKKYRIEPYIKFYVDTEHYYFSILPTALWCPWICRYNNSTGVIDIWWLHFHLLIGKWVELSCRNCRHQEECVKSKRIEWYFDNVFEQGENCSDFTSKY